MPEKFGHGMPCLRSPKANCSAGTPGQLEAACSATECSFSKGHTDEVTHHGTEDVTRQLE